MKNTINAVFTYELFLSYFWLTIYTSCAILKRNYIKEQFFHLLFHCKNQNVSLYMHTQRNKLTRTIAVSDSYPHHCAL